VTKKNPRLCYLCGKPNPDTKEHIPPRGIFPKKPTGQLITVPAHESCNNQFKDDDELLRNLIITASHRTMKGRKAWDEQVVPSWKKNPGAKKKLTDRLTTVKIRNPLTGEEELPAIMGEVSLFDRQIKRFTRGLYYNRYKEPLPSDISIEVSKLQPPEISIPPIQKICENDGKMMKWYNVEPEVFSYFYPASNEDKTIGLAFFIFFNTEVFSASIGLDYLNKRSNT